MFARSIYCTLFLLCCLILLMGVYVYIQAHFFLLLWISAPMLGFCISVEFSFFSLFSFFFSFLFFIILIFTFLNLLYFFYIHSFICFLYYSFPLAVNLYCIEIFFIYLYLNLHIYYFFLFLLSFPLNISVSFVFIALFPPWHLALAFFSSLCFSFVLNW